MGVGYDICFYVDYGVLGIVVCDMFVVGLVYLLMVVFFWVLILLMVFWRVWLIFVMVVVSGLGCCIRERVLIGGLLVGCSMFNWLLVSLLVIR